MANINMDAIAAIVGQARALLSITIAMLAISTISMITRLVVRKRRAKVSFVDYFMLLAQAIFVATCAFYLKASGWEILGAAAETESELAQSGQLTTSIKIATVLYAFTVSAAKFSTAAWLPNLVRWQRVVVNVTLLLNTAMVFAYAAMLLFPCATADSRLTSTCNPTRLSALFTLIWSFSNATTSVVFGALAICSLVKDNSLRKAKILGAFVLLIGSVSLLAAIARCVLILGVVSDIQIQRIVLGELAVLEAGLLITVGCLATLRPMFGRALGYVRDEQLDYQSAPGLERLPDYDDDDDKYLDDSAEKDWADEKSVPSPTTGAKPSAGRNRLSLTLGSRRRSSSAAAAGGMRIDVARMRSRAAQKAKTRRHGLVVNAAAGNSKDMADVDLDAGAPDQGVSAESRSAGRRARNAKKQGEGLGNLTLGGRNLSISSRISNARRQYARGSMNDPLAQHGVGGLGGADQDEAGFRSLLLAAPVRA